MYYVVKVRVSRFVPEAFGLRFLRFCGFSRIFKLGLEKSVRLTYNMLDKVADTIAYTYPFPAW